MTDADYIRELEGFVVRSINLLSEIIKRTAPNGDMADAAVHGLAESYRANSMKHEAWERLDGHSVSVPGTSAERVANMAADAIREGHNQYTAGEIMKVTLTAEQRVLIKGLAHHQIFGHSEDEVVRSLLDYAIRQMVETEYVQKTMAMRVAALGR